MRFEDFLREPEQRSLPMEKAAAFFVALREATLPPSREERSRAYEILKTAARKYASESMLSTLNQTDPLGALGNASTHLGSSEEFATNPSMDKDRVAILPREVNNLEGPAFSPEEMEQLRAQEAIYKEAILNALQKHEEAQQYRAAFENVEAEKQMLQQQLQQTTQMAQQQAQQMQMLGEQAAVTQQQVGQMGEALSQKEQDLLRLRTAIQNYQNQVQNAALQAPVSAPIPMPVAPLPEQQGLVQQPGMPQGEDPQQAQVAEQAKTAAVLGKNAQLIARMFADSPLPLMALGGGLTGVSKWIGSGRVDPRFGDMTRDQYDARQFLNEKLDHYGNKPLSIKGKYDLALAKTAVTLSDISAEFPRGANFAFGASMGAAAMKSLHPFLQSTLRSISEF